MKTNSAVFYKVIAGVFLIVVVLSGLIATEMQQRVYETIGLATKSAHVPRMVVYFGAILLTGAVMFLVLTSRQKNLLVKVLFSSLIAAFFILSIRSWGINNSTAEIGEYLGIYKYRHIVLEGINDEQYCYTIDPLFVRIRSSAASPEYTLFRGVWPALIEREQIERAFVVLSRCD